MVQRFLRLDYASGLKVRDLDVARSSHPQPEEDTWIPGRWPHWVCISELFQRFFLNIDDHQCHRDHQSDISVYSLLEYFIFLIFLDYCVFILFFV